MAGPIENNTAITQTGKYIRARVEPSWGAVITDTLNFSSYPARYPDLFVDDSSSSHDMCDVPPAPSLRSARLTQAERDSPEPKASLPRFEVSACLAGVLTDESLSLLTCDLPFFYDTFSQTSFSILKPNSYFTFNVDPTQLRSQRQMDLLWLNSRSTLT